MTYNVYLAMPLALAFIAALGAVYVWSKDPDRRIRAWELLKLLLRR